MEVDRTYTQETTKQHHPSSHHMDPQRRDEEVGHETPGKETRKKNEGYGIHQERNGEDGHGQKTVAFLDRWPMLPASKQA